MPHQRLAFTHQRSVVTDRKLTVNNGVEHFKRVQMTEIAIRSHHREKEITAYGIVHGLAAGKLDPHALDKMFFVVLHT